MDQYHPELNDEDKSAILQFARRQREEEAADARLLARYSNRAAVVRQVWAVASTAVVSIVLGTVYMFTLKSDQAQTQRDVAKLGERITAAESRVRDLELQMKDKVNRP